MELDRRVSDRVATAKLPIGRLTVVVSLLCVCGVPISVGSDEETHGNVISRMSPNRYQVPVFATVEVRRDIMYRSVTKDNGTVADLRLDVYLPVGDTANARPAILWLHGGGLKPELNRTQEYIVSIATEFARRGYVSVVPDFRLELQPGVGSKVALLEAVDDCRTALAWMRNHSRTYHIDPRWIALGGGSSGGMIAVNVASIENTAASASGRGGVFALIDLWGSPPLSRVMGEINTHFPPTVIIHGTQDAAVPFFQSELLVAKLKEVGVNHLLHPIPGAPHTPTAHMGEIIETTAQFLYALLAKGRPR